MSRPKEVNALARWEMPSKTVVVLGLGVVLLGLQSWRQQRYLDRLQGRVEIVETYQRNNQEWREAMATWEGEEAQKKLWRAQLSSSISSVRQRMDNLSCMICKTSIKGRPDCSNFCEGEKPPGR